MIHPSVDYVLFQLNALNKVYGNGQHVTKVTMTMPGTTNTTEVQSEKVEGAAQIALKGVCDYYSACFSLDKAKFKEMLASNVKFTFVRLKGGFEQGAPEEIIGEEKVYEFCTKFLFDITSNFTVRSLKIAFNGQNSTVDTDVDEDKTIGEKTTRYHMDCHDFITFNENGKIKTFMCRSSKDPLKV